MRITRLTILVLFCFAACTSEREAPNGLKVKVLRKGTGEFAKSGEFLVTNMVIKDAKDSVWRDTREQGIPLIVPVGLTSAVSTEVGIESAFRVLKNGDSVEIRVTVKSIYKDQPLPTKAKPEDPLTFVFTILDITDQRGANAIYQEVQAQEAQRNRGLEGSQLTVDTVAIDAYLATNKINAVKDLSGLRYMITRQGKGARPTLSSTVKVKYKGTLMENGVIFDQGLIEYPLTRLVTGWQVGFQLLSKGSKAILYVPSSLGYGASGFQPGIPPNANLIFEVELIDFK